MIGTSSSCATPTAFASHRAGFTSGPRKLKTVGTPISRRTGAAWAKPGWNALANAKVSPTRRKVSATRAASIVRSSPRAASTSLEPDFDELARLPCLTTGTPAAAMTIAAIVETFTVPTTSPPVPTMSSAIGSTSNGTAASRIASRKPTTSSTVSPFARSATAKAAICAAVARPWTISSMAHVDCLIERSSRAMSALMTAGQESVRDMARWY